MWSCHDYSDGLLTEREVGIEFDRGVVALEFKKCFDRGQRQMGMAALNAASGDLERSEVLEQLDMLEL